MLRSSTPSPFLPNGFIRRLENAVKLFRRGKRNRVSNQFFGSVEGDQPIGPIDIACALTRSWMWRATGSTVKDFCSRLPAHSSHGSFMRSASASVLASSGVSGSRVAFDKSSGKWSAAPVGSKRSSGGRRRLWSTRPLAPVGRSLRLRSWREGYFCVCLRSDSR